MDDDDEKWSRDGSKDEETSPDIEVLVEAEAIVEAEIAADNEVWEKGGKTAAYDKHLKFIGKKLSDINHNITESNSHLWWLTIGVKIGFFMAIVSLGLMFLGLIMMFP